MRTPHNQMYARLEASGLRTVTDKLDAGVRLDGEDGLQLFECPDLLAVGWLANREREKRHGPLTFFNHNIRLEATNVCVASCLFCAFARLQPGDSGAYTMSLEQAWQKLRDRGDQALTEVHVVNIECNLMRKLMTVGLISTNNSCFTYNKCYGKLECNPETNDETSTINSTMNNRSTQFTLNRIGIR